MRPRALVVEDDRQTRESLRAILEGEQLDVDVAADGEMAIEYLRSEQYSVILLDIVLPTTVSGTDVMEYLRLNNPPALEKTIVVTGLNVREIRMVFPTVMHALSKPVLPARLRATVRACVGRMADGAADVIVA
jgi:DNA-binding response OmpR family regulator